MVQETNDTRYGLLTLLGWCVLALIYLFTIDFEQGKRDAGAPDAKPAQA